MHRLNIRIEIHINIYRFEKLIRKIIKLWAIRRNLHIFIEYTYLNCDSC